MSMRPQSRTAHVLVKVPFHDLDPVGIVWHGNYSKYFELARCELLQSFNYNYDEMMRSGYAWPIIDLHLRYVKATRFNETLKVQATLREWEHRLKIDYLATDAASGARVCKGSSVQVAVDMSNHEMLLRSPKILFERLGLAA
jgi:acyl-CoA thioester hydrolase